MARPRTAVILYIRTMRYTLVVLAACSGGGDDGGGGSGTPDAPKATRSGYVSIQSYDAMNAPNTPTRGGTASAGFYASGAFCTNMARVESCDFAMCVTTPPAAVSAGAITITGAAQPIMLMPAADKTYNTYMVATPLFAGGETITFAAAGGDVPAFDKTITAPTKTTITAPAEPPSSSPYLAIARASDFTVSWTGGGSGQVQIVLSSPQGDLRLFCRFDASAGTGKVPSGALLKLPSGTGSFAMASIAQTVHEAGDWAVDVSAYYNAVWPDASIVSGPAMLQ